MATSIKSDKPESTPLVENVENCSETVAGPEKCSRWRKAAEIMFGGGQFERRVPAFVLDPDSVIVFYWMGAMALATVYNAWMTGLRIAFPEVREEPIPVYLKYLDIICDFIYAADIVVQLRTAYLQDGIPVFEPSKIRKYYSRQPYFAHDLVSAVPIEIFLSLISDVFGRPEYLCTLSAARLTKLFKFHVLYRFYDLAESRTSIPHFIRVFRLSLSLAIIIHWIACLYYLVSEYEGLGSNDWVYTNDTNQQNFRRKYIVCMYWSAMTLTTIGNTNSPETDLEYIFTGVIFLTGVFVFATVLGNVGDVISSMNANRQEFQARMDHIKMYLTHKKVPASLQLKIKKWAEYSWSRTKATDESRLLNILPERLRAEVAVHVHLDNLKKVKIFEQCETGFLCELVLKLRSQVFSPGDYICKAGETGREMFIINHGKVEVLVPNPSTNKEMVVAVLCEGNYFGEISLLRLDGVQNRRTADVRSIGYSELLCLSRRDLMTALVEYPEAKSVLEAQAKKRMKTSLQAQRAFSVDTLLRSSQEYPSFDSPISFREENRGRDVSEIKAMIEELKSINKVPGKTIWQLIARCELLQDKVREKEKEIEESKRKVQELEGMLSNFSSFSVATTCRNEPTRRSNQKITKQFSHEEGRYSVHRPELKTWTEQDTIIGFTDSTEEQATTCLNSNITPTSKGDDKGENTCISQRTHDNDIIKEARTMHFYYEQCPAMEDYNARKEDKDSALKNKDVENAVPSEIVQGSSIVTKGVLEDSEALNISRDNINDLVELNQPRAYHRPENKNYHQRQTTMIRTITEEEDEEEKNGKELRKIPSYEERTTAENVSHFLKRNSQTLNDDDLRLEKTFYDEARRRSRSYSRENVTSPSHVSIVTHLCESLDISDDTISKIADKDSNLLGQFVEVYSDESGSRKSSMFTDSERDQDSDRSSDG